MLSNSDVSWRYQGNALIESSLGPSSAGVQVMVDNSGPHAPD
jgi:hypothetical protein